MKVRIEKCSNPFAWYASLITNKPKEETKESLELRTFDVTYDTKEMMYKTYNDVAGPNVKGFIHSQDLLIL